MQEDDFQFDELSMIQDAEGDQLCVLVARATPRTDRKTVFHFRPDWSRVALDIDEQWINVTFTNGTCRRNALCGTI